MSVLSNTTSTYADITARPAPSCSKAWRSSARRLVKMSPRTNRMAAKKLLFPAPFRPTTTLHSGLRSMLIESL